MKDDPIEAFAWLLTQFRRYTRNQITWIEVRRTLQEADDLIAGFNAHRVATDRIIEIARDIREIIYGGSAPFPKAELDDALTEYDNEAD